MVDGERIAQYNPLLREPEDAAPTETNQARQSVPGAILRAERRHHFLLERLVRDLLDSEFILARRALELQFSLALDVAAPDRAAGAEVGLAVHHHDPDRGGPRPAALVDADHFDGPEISPLAPVGHDGLGAAREAERECQDDGVCG